MYDPDESNSSSLFFYILDEITLDYFYIDPHDGSIYPSVDFSHVDQQAFEFQVDVTDAMFPGYLDQTTVKVTTHSSFLTLDTSLYFSQSSFLTVVQQSNLHYIVFLTCFYIPHATSLFNSVPLYCWAAMNHGLINSFTMPPERA